MIPNAREHFALPADVAYFNCASLAPLSIAAQKAGQDALQIRGEPWRIKSSDWFDAVERRRTLFAGLIGISVENVALVPAASYGLAVAARNLVARPGQRVLLIAAEFPSNVYTWRAFCAKHGCDILTVQRAPDQDWTSAILENLDERVAVAALPNVQWTDGAHIDLVAISKRVRELGAKLVVDASQSLGARPFDFANVRPDFLTAVGYKWLLGPYGVGYLYVADEHLEGTPLEENWISREGSDDFASLIDYRMDYRSGARRFDVGERSLLETTPVAVAVLEQLVKWGIDEIASTIEARAACIVQAATEMGLALTTQQSAPRHMVGLSLSGKELPCKGADPAEVLRSRNVHVALRGTSMRISPHVYNDDNDLDRLLESLKILIQ